MFKRPALATLALAVGIVLAATAPSQALVLNHGLIVVHNESKESITINLEREWYTGHPIDRATIPAGGTYDTSACCYMAGSPYRIDARTRTNPGIAHYTKISPRLCNRNGIPYGYEVVSWDGTNFHIDPHGCYEGPL